MKDDQTKVDGQNEDDEHTKALGEVGAALVGEDMENADNAETEDETGGDPEALPDGRKRIGQPYSDVISVAIDPAKAIAKGIRLVKVVNEIENLPAIKKRLAGERDTLCDEIESNQEEIEVELVAIQNVEENVIELTRTDTGEIVETKPFLSNATTEPVEAPEENGEADLDMKDIEVKFDDQEKHFRVERAEGDGDTLLLGIAEETAKDEWLSEVFNVPGKAGEMVSDIFDNQDAAVAAIVAAHKQDADGGE